MPQAAKQRSIAEGIRKIPSPLRWIFIVALGIACVFGVRYATRMLPMKTASTEQPPAAPSVSIAVLPFHNASGDATLDWLGPSLADMLTTDIDQSEQLRLVS